MNESVLQSYSCADGSGLSSNSVTIEYWDSSNDEDKIPALVIAAITLCFMLVGLPSNLVIIVAILWKHLYRQPTYILLLNLSSADLFLCILLLPFVIISGFEGEFIFGVTDYVRCKFCQFGVIFQAFLLMSIHSLSFLSVDRFIYIKYSMKYHKIVTVRRVLTVLSILWVSSILIACFPLFGFGDLAYSAKVAICVVKFTGETKLAKNIHYPILLAIILSISVAVLVAGNIWVGCIVQKHLRKIYDTKRKFSGNEEAFMQQIRKKLSKDKHSKQLMFMKVFGSIIIANVITWMPLIIRVVYTAISGQNTSTVLMILVYVSVISVVAVHPIIQASLIPELKLIFLECIRYCRRKAGSKLTGNSSEIVVHSITNNSDQMNIITSDKKYSKCCKCKCLFFFNVSFLPSIDDLELHI